MSEFLFDDFRPVSSKQWKQTIQMELQGLDYNKTLLNTTNEGITIKPFYHRDEFKQVEHTTCTSNFSICQSIFVQVESKSNFLAKKALKSGATSIQFVANKPFDFKILLQGIFANKTAVHFDFRFFEESFLKELIEFVKNEKVFLNIDIIGNLIKSGNWFHDNHKDHEVLYSLSKFSKNSVALLGVDISTYQNAGANTVQQVAYALAHANEYMYFFSKQVSQNKLDKKQFDLLVQQMQFNFSIGGNYFFEIAKLRAFRYLFFKIAKKYNIEAEAKIFAQPSLRNKTIYAYHINMLRTTTECMSAILGGANTISNLAFDALFHKKNEFGERIARNQLLLLQKECQIDNSNPSDGSYFLEELTHEIATKALELFKDIEKKGGFVNQLFEGTIQRKIKENAQKEEEQFLRNEIVLTGINKQVYSIENLKDSLEIYPFTKRKSHQTILVPIVPLRLSEKLEKDWLERKNVSEK